MLNLPAPAKLNLFLHVVGRRDDGYHRLQTAFVFIDLADQIDLRLRRDANITRSAGLAEVPVEQDLTVRAARLLQARTGSRHGVDIAVRKHIPAGGGLGGGSSDAATVLLGLNRLWKLHLSNRELRAIGLELGADVPVFVGGNNAIAQGVGELLEPVTLPPMRLRLAWPGVAVPTAAIFSAPELTRNTAEDRIQGFSGLALAGGRTFMDWLKSETRNDLQPVAAGKYPEVAAALKWLERQKDAGLVRMSGSGACCFALLEGESAPDAPSGDLQVWELSTLTVHPLHCLALDA
jgi:4-diphosphocytidyl-2-C-methyl-D-erythritol kinase